MNVPELRFPEFSEEWEERKFGELFEFLPTNSFSRADLNDENGIVQNIHYGDIHTKFPTILDCRKIEIPFINEDISLEKIKKDSYCINGDLVIADASEDYKDIGKAIELKNVGEKKLLAGLHTFLVRDKSGLTVEGYRGYMLLNNDLKLQIKKIATGISVLGISKTNLSPLKVNIPPIPEQEKIASFLSQVDKKIGFLEKKQELWKTYKNGMMQQIFTQKLRFKDKNGNNYPDWKDKELGKVSDVRDGTHDSPKYIKNGLPLVTSKNLLDNGKIDFKNVNYILKSDYDNINKRSKVDIGDILFGMIGTIGNPVMVESDGFAIKNVALIKESSELKNNYLVQLLKSEIIARQFYSLNAGGTQKFLALGLIRELEVPIPTLQEQAEIANFISAIDKKIEQINKEIKINKKFKKGLLQKMFC